MRWIHLRSYFLFLQYFSIVSTHSSFSCTQPHSGFLKNLVKTVSDCLIPSSNYPPPLTYPPPPPPTYHPQNRTPHVLPFTPPNAHPPRAPPIPPTHIPPRTLTHLPPTRTLHTYQKAKIYKVNAKLNAKLCKIYAKFNAKYVRSTLKSTQNM